MYTGIIPDNAEDLTLSYKHTHSPKQRTKNNVIKIIHKLIFRLVVCSGEGKITRETWGLEGR